MLRVAIDGPGGTGKSTIAKAVAARFGIEYIDTGAMYRALGLKARRNGINEADEEAVKDMLAATSIDFVNGHTLLDGEDVSGLIRTNEISMAASNISKLAIVRAKVDEVSRYLDQLLAAGKEADYETIFRETQARDYQDSHREVSPLRAADDAVFLDTSDMDIEENIDAVADIITAKTGRRA